MVKYRRYKLKSKHAVYFLTVGTGHRKKWFQKSDDASICVHAMKHVVEKYGVEYPAWIIMPDHIHWLIRPGYADYSKVVSAFKRRVSSRLKRKYGLEDGSLIWQDRFWEHTIRDENEFDVYLDYIHFNPVKHGYVNSPREWKLSSFHKHVKSGFYEEDWTLSNDISIEGDEFDI